MDPRINARLYWCLTEPLKLNSIHIIPVIIQEKSVQSLALGEKERGQSRLLKEEMVS